MQWQLLCHLVLLLLASSVPHTMSHDKEIDVEQAMLDKIAKDGELQTEEFAAELRVSHQAVVGSLKSLESDKLVSSKMESKPRWKFSEEALEIMKNGSPEGALWSLLEGGPVDRTVLESKLGRNLDIAIKNGMKNKLFKLNKADGKQLFEREPNAPQFADKVRDALLDAEKGKQVSDKDADELKKRKLATVEQAKVFVVTKGDKFTTKRVKPVSDITREMMLDGSWETAAFKKYTLDKAEGREPLGGQLHPLLKVRQEFREIFLELGFQEMDTTAWVESSFWNFDSLFVPQNHPARDSQDTFFVSDPATSQAPDPAYLSDVKKIHEASYCTQWREDESAKNVLRTHTTGVSSWVLRQLAQASPVGPDGTRQFVPGKYFSIDRVFRNEEMDKTHLCEFHQIEGFIVDRNLSLANMMHTLHQFFKRIGIEKLRFKPAFNPYTEPSMEIFGYHAGMQRWMEVGNSGMFRPEMLQPMGFDKDVTAIAWGLSLERPTMIKYGINNIHELFGHKVDLKFIRRSRIARY
jgi:phenylalanyl-tRNA synthetase alpha chain